MSEGDLPRGKWVRQVAVRAGLAVLGALAVLGTTEPPLFAGPARAHAHTKIPKIRPSDFGFRLEDGWHGCVDSDSGTVREEINRGGDTTFVLRFTPSELDTIYAEFLRVGIFGVTEPHPPFDPPGDVVETIEPETWHRFEIRGAGLEKHFWWEGESSVSFRGSPEAPRLFAALRIVEDTVQRRPEYIGLRRLLMIRL